MHNSIPHALPRIHQRMHELSYFVHTTWLYVEWLDVIMSAAYIESIVL